MRVRGVGLILAGASMLLVVALTAGVWAQSLWAQSQGQQELPSAPSASQQEQQEKAKPSPPPPPPPAPVQPAPASTSANQAPKETLGTPGQAPVAPTTQPAAAGGQADAGQNPSDQDDSFPRIVKIVNEVNVVFTVTDKHGNYVKDLKQSDFKVIDDNQPGQIRSFHAETDLPLQVGLLVDASNSVRDRFKFEQESAIEFLNQTVRPKYDQAFVVGFDATPEVTQDFTDNTEFLSRGVRMLRPGGGTAMYDALYSACRDKLMKAPRNGPVRRAIILLSDGDDNQSHTTREEAIEMAQRAEVIVYTISTNVSGHKIAGDKVLERIADATGGRSFAPFKITDVADAFAEIQDELRSQYALSYKPADFQADGSYHPIEITAQDHKNLRVRSRRGYYAPKG